jgi:hypothetical protein
VEPSAAPTELNPTPRDRVLALMSKGEAQWKRLPRSAQLGLFGALLFFIGLMLGVLGSRSGSASTSANTAAELAAFAKGVSAAEGETARSALLNGDVVSAYAVFKTAGAYDHLRADPRAQALRARLALINHDPSDALDWLEQALGNEPSMASQRWVGDAVVQTFGANKPGRTTSLLGRVPKKAAHDALVLGCTDWQFKVRHSAADALKAQSDACPDPVGFLVLDAWELDRCDVARPVVKQLSTYAQSDARVPAVLDAVSRRDALKGCVGDLIPKASASK